MKALITGVNGFVGGYLADYLISQNIEVYGTVLKDSKCSMDTNAIKVLNMDVTDSSTVNDVISNISPDYIFHLAAQSSAAVSWGNPQLTMDININGTINILEAARALKSDIRILLVGSSEEYGFVRPENVPVSEEHSLEPGNPYAISKIAQSMIGQLYARAYNMKIIIARAFNHIGPRQSPIFVAADFARKIAEIEKGISPPLLKVGNLDAERDFSDVRDIVKAYWLLIQYGKFGENYNVGSGKAMRIKDILDMFLQLTTARIEIENDPFRMRPADVPIIAADISKIKKDIQWQPEIDINETLKDILDYWRKIV